MANKKISDLPAAGAAAASDLYEVEQGGVSKKETATQILAIGKVTAQARQNQGLAFGVAQAATHTGLLIVVIDLNGSGSPAAINLEINAALQYQLASNGADISMVMFYYVNAGDMINIVDVLDPGANAIDDNFILPLVTST